MHQGNTRHASWRQLLEAPPPASHIVQLYDSEAFLAAAVGHFAAEGLHHGEAVLLTGTAGHLAAIERELRARGIEQRAVVADGRLIVADVDGAIPAVMAGRAIDAPRFRALAGKALGRASADTRFSGVRWWGEISNVLHLGGNTDAALAAEELTDAWAEQHGVKIFCSYECDRFDPRGYDELLPQICALHSHVIPAENYVLHRMAVNRAVQDIVGDIRGPMLQSLMSWKGLACDLPSSQAILFWIRDAMPECLAEILARAKAYHQELALDANDAKPA